MQLCPFCQLFGEEPQPIGPDFFGQQAKIGPVPSCDACATVASFTDSSEHLLMQLKEQTDSQEAK